MIPVFQVLLPVAVISSVDSIAVCTVTTPDELAGLTLGIEPDAAQIVSPRINSGLAMLSFAANFFATVSVLVAPYPSFLNR